MRKQPTKITSDKSPKKLLEAISKKTKLPSAKTRRQALVEEMGALNSKGFGCINCPGHCCTNEHNSMQVDPVQALELICWLEEQGRLGEDLLITIEECISSFRLDKEFFLGRGRELRQHYTCPFYGGQSKGCSISRHAKPYGCLAFNPLEEKVDVAGKCGSNIGALTERESAFSEKEAEANEVLKESLGLYWSKKNLPFALRDMLRAIGKVSTHEEGET